MKKKKKIIGVIEKIVIAGCNGKKKKVLARIDTGAALTSIDETIARKIGYLETIKEFEKRLSICEKKILKMNRAERENCFSNTPGLKKYIKINSAHGFSFRPIVNISLNINNMDIESEATIIDRSHLKYPVIIGRKDLSGFLVNIISEKI